MVNGLIEVCPCVKMSEGRGEVVYKLVEARAQGEVSERGKVEAVNGEREFPGKVEVGKSKRKLVENGRIIIEFSV